MNQLDVPAVHKSCMPFNCFINPSRGLSVGY
jgi:hypothetical protein